MAADKIFKTQDMCLASAIVALLRKEPSFSVERGITLFCFPAAKNLYHVMSWYNSGVTISAIKYSRVIKRLRREAMVRRFGGAA